MKRNLKDKGIITILSLCLLFSGVAVEPTYAAAKPAKVTGLAMSARTASTVTLKWKKAKRAKKYQIGYKQDGSGWKYKTVKSKYKSKKLTGLKAYKRYSFRVRGVAGKRKGKWSSTISTYTCPSTYNWPELLTVKNVTITDVGLGSIALSWETEKPADERIANAQKLVDDAQAKVNELTEQTEPIVTEPDEPVNETVIEDSVIEDTEETTEPEEPTLEEQLLVAQEELANAQAALQAEKDVKTLYDKCLFRIYRSTDNKNWSLFANNISNATREYTCRRCDAGVTYYFKVVPVDTTTYQTFTHEGSASNVVSGTVKTIPGLNFKQKYTTRNLSYIQNWSWTLKGLMLHSVGAAQPNAETWYNIYNQKNYNKAAVHAFIDGNSGLVWQTLPWTMRGGHAGKLANNQFIGIEMCESSSIKYTSGTKFKISDKSAAKKSAELTYDRSVKLFAYLCDYFGIDPKGKFKTTTDKGRSVEVNTIMSHNEWRLAGHDGHYDPEHYWTGLGLNNDGVHNYTMNQFRNDVAETLDQYKIK